MSNNSDYVSCNLPEGMDNTNTIIVCCSFASSAVSNRTYIISADIDSFIQGNQVFIKNKNSDCISKRVTVILYKYQ